MRLAVIVRDSTLLQPIRLNELGIEHFILHYNILGKVAKAFQKEPRYSAYIPSSVLLSASKSPALVDKLIGELPTGLTSVYLDMGTDVNKLLSMTMVLERMLEKLPKQTFGLMAEQLLLLEHRLAFAEILRTARTFPVAVLGNGLTEVEPLLTVLKGEYPNAVPCVLVLTNLDKTRLGEILWEAWDRFPEFIFWSHMTLSHVDTAAVQARLLPKHLLMKQQYRCIHSTSIRRSASLNSEVLANKTVEGNLYNLVLEVPKGDITFAKLEDNTYVVFKAHETENFSKETDL